MTPSASATESTAKKDVQKLQRAIVDGLEDVKGQEIQVFDTSALSALFERVIIASGTSNRQTKALASSVRDAVREAGFPKPRIEGEENGEWIIVDCGAAVAHIMQPTIRSYYRLEEIWGETPVRLKLGAPKPISPKMLKLEKAEKLPKDKTAKKTAAVKTPAKKAAVKTKPTPAKKTTTKIPVVKVGAPAKSAKSAKATKPATKPAAKTSPKSAVKKAAVKSAPAKRAKV
jgi:ribosome-associated protein